MRSQADRKRLARVVKILVVIAAATAATTNVATLNTGNAFVNYILMHTFINVCVCAGACM